MSYTLENNIKNTDLDPATSFARVKAKKISTAVYLVTNFIKENEPIRNRLREKSVELVSQLSVTDSLKNISHKNNIRDIIFEITELLDISRSTGLISDMNSNILTEEGNILINFIEEKNNSLKSGGSFTKDFFSVPNKELVSGNYSEIYNSDYQKDKSTKHYRESIIKDNKIFEEGTPKIKRTKPDGSVIVKRKNNRRDVILNLLKKQKKVTVRDISAAIQNCSQKTLQRELLSLVKDGVLMKEGERRWSTYFLA